MHPCTSYCPPTRSPRDSLGTNEYRVPHTVQKPSAGPGWPSRARPTGWWHSGLPQNRLASGTCGSVRMAAAGSPFGTGGIATIPAPRLPRALADGDDALRAVRTDGSEKSLRAVVVDNVCGATVSGAVPQMSQWPPTTVPPHPGSAHIMVSPHTVPSADPATVRGYADGPRTAAPTFRRRASGRGHR